MTPDRKLLFFCVVWVLIALGCEPAPPIQIASGTNLTRPVTAPFEVPDRSDVTPKLKPEDQKRLDEYNALLDAFLERSDEAFSKTDTEGYLPGLEKFFMSTGRVFEMMDLYRTVYNKNGPTHYITPRLAWAYISVGQDEAARILTNATLKNRPNDPLGHFIDGYLISRGGDPDVELVKKVRAAWVRALEIAPNFNGPAGISGQMLRARIKDMDRALESNLAPPPKPKPTPTIPPPPTPSIAVQPDAGQATASNTADAGATPNPDAAPLKEPPAVAKPTGNPKLIEAEASLAQGNYTEASQAFQDVLRTNPESRRAEYGFILSVWKAPGERDERKARMILDKVAARPDLEARELYELGIIYHRKLDAREQAVKLWERARDRDPAFAASVGLEKWLK